MAAVPDKEKALSRASASERKGSVMRLGERPAQHMSVIPPARSPWTLRSGWVVCRADGSWNLDRSDGKTTVALHAVANASGQAGSRRSSTPSTRSTRSTRRRSGWTPTLLVSQPDTGEQALEIADMLIAPGRWTSSSSTRSPRWCGPRSRARWVTVTSACKPG